MMNKGEVMNKCVFYNGKTCRALKEKKCEGCRFFKTTTQHMESQERARQRVDSLPIEKQLYIKEKYY